jgi:hypothetical protein
VLWMCLMAALIGRGRFIVTRPIGQALRYEILSRVILAL